MHFSISEEVIINGYLHIYQSFKVQYVMRA